MALCEASAIHIFPIDSQLLGHLFLSISLPCAKAQPHFPSNYFSMILQSFCPEWNFVKEVYSRHVQMRWTFSTSFIWSNHHSAHKLSSCNLSMWAQIQILVSGQIFSLWSNYIFILLHLSWKFSRAFSYPYKHSPNYFGSIYYISCPVQFFQVSVKNEALWSKWHFGISKCHETFTVA